MNGFAKNAKKAGIYAAAIAEVMTMADELKEGNRHGDTESHMLFGALLAYVNILDAAGYAVEIEATRRGGRYYIKNVRIASEKKENETWKINRKSAIC